MYMNNDPKNEKWIEWGKKTEEEQEKIAEENGWGWYFEWDTIGDILRAKYEKADPDPKPANKYGGYDQYYAKHEIGKSYIYLGMDASFHRSDKPTSTWTEFTPCTNTKCSWHKDDEKAGNCRYYGERPRLFQCFEELFATIQSFIDVCGIENIDELQKDLNIHPDIIGWFKEGDDYFKNKESDNMKHISNKRAAERYMFDNWHLLWETKDIERFLNYCQLWILRRKNHLTNEYVRNEFKYVDTEKVMEIVYDKYIKNYDNVKDMVAQSNDSESKEIDIRNTLLREAKNVLYRLNNEELRDIIFSHPFRDLDDPEYDDERINAENLTKEYTYDSSLANKVIEKCKNTEEEIIKKIIKEIEKDISFDYEYDEKECNAETGIKPEGNFAYMLEHFSDLVDPNDVEYEGNFGYNGKYIRDVMKVINRTEEKAKLLREKYKKYGVVVTIGDFNVGCEYGVTIYIWIPHQTQKRDE